MQKYRTDKFTIDFSFYIFSAAFFLLLPFRFVLAWLLAVAVHELSHYLALIFCHVPIYSVKLQGLGMTIDTAPMSGKRELICALAGPLGGLSLLAVARWMPFTAICASIQSCYNLLPVFPLDGGRALRIVLFKFFGKESGEILTKIVSYVIIGLLAVWALYLTLRFDIGILPICIIGILYLRTTDLKFPCKPH